MAAGLRRPYGDVMGYATDLVQRSGRRLASMALAVDFVAILSLVVAAAIFNTGSDRAISIGSGIVLICMWPASIVGLVLAIRAARRARGWENVLVVPAVILSSLLLLYGAIFCVAILQGGG